MPCSQRDTRSCICSPRLFDAFHFLATSISEGHLLDCSADRCFSLQVLPPPAGYVPIRTPARKLAATPTPIGGMTGFHMQAEDRTTKQMNDQPSGNLPFLKPDDIQYFDKLLVSISRDKIMAQSV